MATGKGLALLEDRLTESQGVGAFDPTIVITIIQAIIPLIQSCLHPTPQALRNSKFNRARVAAAIRREARNQGGGAPDWDKTFALTDEVFRLAREAKDDELTSLIDDCCDGS